MTPEDKQRSEIARQVYENERELMSPDVVWHVPGQNPVSGVYRGAKAYFEDMVTRMGPLDEWDFAIENVMVNGAMVVVSGRLRGLRKKHRIDLAAAHVMRIENGKVVEGWGFVEKQDVLDSFFAA
jgi:ketosteroid isomerase-like protein